MEGRDALWLLFEAVAEHVEAIDDIIDRQLQPRLDRRQDGWFTKVAAVIDMEAAAAEVALWVANYRRAPKEVYKLRLFKHDQEFRKVLAHFFSLDLTAEEKRLGSELTTLYDRMMRWIEKGVAAEERQREHVKQFVSLRQNMDRLLDEEIQTLAQKTLDEPRVRADRVTDAVLWTTQLLIPVFLVFTVGVALLLIRMVTRPVEALTASTESIANGDLSHRLIIDGRDEFADLARHFNDMVAQLEATTVSKARLEASEEQLQTTVEALREEIVERERVESDRQRLQDSLRRSELLAAMGTLVAGVAHEVRNPLFAISSTLDAFTARFGAQAEYQRYFSVLRREADRLTTLMRSLLDYGKPPAIELTQMRIDEVIVSSTRACTPLSQSAGVTLRYTNNGNGALVRVDRHRLQQIFDNLVQNAIQHSPTGGTVEITTTISNHSTPARVECVVTDNGPGFAPEDLPRIFEPFFTRRRGGTGLGLAIAQRIVEEHGGMITAGNRPMGGAMVTVQLPMAEKNK
jgi:signal transduction histidine kinase